MVDEFGGGGGIWVFIIIFFNFLYIWNKKKLKKVLVEDGSNRNEYKVMSFIYLYFFIIFCLNIFCSGLIFSWNN